MSKAGTVARFMWFPFHKRDFLAFTAQWAIIGKVLFRTYAKLGLVKADEPLGIHPTLVSAWRGLVSRWQPVLAGGWASGAGFGLFGRLGGVADAIWAGRHEIVRDAAAVSMGWCMWLALWFAGLWYVMHEGIGTAHAQLITAASGTGAGADIARKVLGELFPFIGAGTALSQGIGKMAAGLGVLAAWIGGGMSLWTAGVLVVEWVDNPDSFKQRYSVPMFIGRVVFAMGLLIPLSGGWGGGQMLAGQAGVFASDQASKAWAETVSFLGDSKQWVVQPTVPEVELVTTISQIAAAEACMAAVNQDPARSDGESVVYDASTGRYDYYLKRHFWNSWWPETRSGCGAVTFPKPSTESSQALSSDAVGLVVEAQKKTFESLRANTIKPAVEAMIKNRIACRDEPDKCQPEQEPNMVGAWVTQYRTELQSNIKNAWGSVSQSTTAQISKSASDGGWIGAASWAFNLSKMQSSIDGAGNSLPRVSGPKIAGVEDQARAALSMVHNGLIASGSPMGKAELSIASGAPSALDELFQAVTPSLSSVFPQLDTMSPLAGMAVLGKWVMGVAVGLKAAVSALASDWFKTAITTMELAGAVETAGSSVVLGEMAKAALDTLKDVVDVIWFPLLLIGMALAYFVPALPFIRMLFGVMGWLIAFVETIIMVPLSLVLMINAEHGGVFGPAAKGALWNIVALAARPFLTVIGFMAGLALITIMIGLLNTLFIPMMQNNESNFVFFGFFAYIVIYLGLAYVIVNTATKLAELLPMAAYRWLGANAGGERDDGSAVGAAIGAALGKFNHLNRGGRNKPTKPA